MNRPASESFDERGLPRSYPFQSDWEISPVDLKCALDGGDTDLLLLDCRTPGEHATARIEGALLVPMDQFAARLEELREHDERPIVVYCHHGRRSLIVAAALRKAGFDDVKSLAGGIEQWSAAIDPSVPRY